MNTLPQSKLYIPKSKHNLVIPGVVLDRVFTKTLVTLLAPVIMSTSKSATPINCVFTGR